MSISQGIKDTIKSLFGVEIGADMPEPPVVFSDEEPPTDTYGTIEPGAVYEALSELRGRYLDRFPVYQEWICRLTGDGVRRTLQEENGDPGIPEELKDLVREVKRVLCNEKTTFTRLGQYDSKTKTITIFNRSFDSVNPMERAERIRKTIAHETFHTVHHFLAPGTFSEYGTAAKAVKEALADFFAYVLCLEENAALTDSVSSGVCSGVAEERYRFWKRNLYTADPYHNAIFHMYRSGTIHHDSTYPDCQSNGDLGKMIRVLELSKTDMQVAYEELVPQEFRFPGAEAACPPGAYLVVFVVFPNKPTQSYSYLFDPGDSGPVAVGDFVAVPTNPGVEVMDVKIMDQAEYDALCGRLHLSGLKIAKRIQP